jgi:serine/threonine protein phosphatase PrpC
MHIAHVGDTRLYAFAGNRLIKLSKDHSYIGEFEEQGILSEEEAMNHPARNVVTRVAADAPMKEDSVHYQMNTLPIGQGITWLLCSDGLFDMINSAQIIHILSTDTTVEEKAEALVNAANTAGCRDNVTVVLVQDDSPMDDGTEEVMQTYAEYARNGYPTKKSPE